MMFTECPSDASRLRDYSRLFSACFPAATKLRRVDYLEWLYLHNPAGPVVGFDAYDSGALAAHYACIPMALRLGGKNCRGILSLNTATHPDYQGRGLFTKLAELTYEAAWNGGCRAVYGVANANSTPGFLRKLGFSLIGPLQAKIGLGGLNADWDRIRNVSTCVEWNDESLRWRVSNPASRVMIRDCDDESVAFSTPYRPGVMAWAQRPAHLADNMERAGSALPSLRLWLGLMPPDAFRPNFYADLPNRLRPSPLILILRVLEPVGSFPINEVYIDFLDFDAF